MVNFAIMLSWSTFSKTSFVAPRCQPQRALLTTSPPQLRLREVTASRWNHPRRAGPSMSATPPTDTAMTPSKNDTGKASRVVVVAVDETEDSVKALKWTLDHFYRTGDAVHLLHVIPYVHQQVLTSTVYYTPPVLDPEVTEQLYLNAEEVVNEKFIPVMKQYGVEYQVDMVKEKGSETIGDAVCHFAADLKACAVVVASHKKHWLQAWLMGSSSQEIAGKAPIPVIVYHG